MSDDATDCDVWQAYRRVAELDAELSRIRARMEALVRRFRHEYPSTPRPIYPGVHVGGRERGPVIRWRLGGRPGHGQSWLAFTSPKLQHHLETHRVPHATRRAWLELDRQAQRLNIEASMAAAERRVLDGYAMHMDRLARWAETYQSS
ncbi:hypothetical protein CKO15_06125 [Halorhodospira abdelmalekii]|uniref:hypothetical protein n=1 Tax=Halorhodospira abdelmalekii TaxID=421629 RepID=UPI001904D1A4|nr:hypothetical protein [Halorhodospira abdelmalekii]MBK1734873.1 hypothetical protein [Halorhodospira abdelmalekii]